ncbi:MAG TPA: hypothetical protein VK206_19245 [Anaerolineales bacterium]|nr:hypothetical protein [Anaerolineales bacterium]
MDILPSSLSINQPCNEIFSWLNQSLARKGLRVLRTFDLHDVRLSHEECSCPDHGTDQCDCQMVVLLIYGKSEEPVTLILHGNDGQTWLSIVNNSIKQADPSIQLSIEQALEENPSR